MNMLSPIHDAALDFAAHVYCGMPASRAVVPWSTASVPSARSRFENVARLARQLPPTPRDLLGVLLATVLPANGRGSQVLRPLWVQEAVHRAYSLMRLVDLRSRCDETLDDDPIVTRLEAAVAGDLAVQFSELEGGRERDVLPCTAVLRGVVTGLGTLFGCPAEIVLRTKIEDVSLPAYKRRALVLAAAELVNNALLHAFPGRDTGRIDVGLTARDEKSVCLRVADDGIGFAGASPNLDWGVAAGLADLLEAELAYNRVAGWTIAEIVFPMTAN